MSFSYVFYAIKTWQVTFSRGLTTKDDYEIDYLNYKRRQKCLEIFYRSYLALRNVSKLRIDIKHVIQTLWIRRYLNRHIRSLFTRFWSPWVSCLHVVHKKDFKLQKGYHLCLFFRFGIYHYKCSCDEFRNFTESPDFLYDIGHGIQFNSHGPYQLWFGMRAYFPGWIGSDRWNFSRRCYDLHDHTDPFYHSSCWIWNSSSICYLCSNLHLTIFARSHLVLYGRDKIKAQNTLGQKIAVEKNRIVWREFDYKRQRQKFYVTQTFREQKKVVKWANFDFNWLDCEQFYTQLREVIRLKIELIQ